MDRLWITPATGLYARDKLLPASWNRKKPDRPKRKHQKAQETKQKITESIEKRLMAGKDILFNFEQRLQQFFYHAAVLPSMECGLIPKEHLTGSGDGTVVHTHACPNGHHRDGAPDIPLFLRFTSAKRHDSVSFLVAFHEPEEHMPAVSTTNMCPDSAMDN